ncbi:MAG TPA: transaldolase [Gemmatimonadales bacterium]|nr:transaldolase [Gemmatimonadales bacterium]
MSAEAGRRETNPLLQLGQLGQSLWYDYITRDLVASGELARLIAEDGLRGMTSNPTIFEKAIAGSQSYDEDIRRLSDQGRNAGEVFEVLAVSDVQAACDAFMPLYRQSGGADGFVSLEVSPTLAHHAEGTTHEARRLWGAVARPNAMIKIPGTEAGLPAITRTIAEGINVNVTLLFSLERYAAVVEAFLAGLEARLEQGKPVRAIASVASFFVSRVDSKVDALLDGVHHGAPRGAGTPDHPLRGKIAIANASLAYGIFERTLDTWRWKKLSEAGVRPQRPLWASTSTKDPRLPDTYYVEALAAPQTVNTLPPETFEAFRNHGKPAVRIRENLAAAPDQLDALKETGIDLKVITRELEEEGVAKFAASHAAVLAGIDAKMGALASR